MPANRKLSQITVSAALRATLTNDIDGGTNNVSWAGGVTQSLGSFINGTAANQANRIWQDQGRPITSGANEDLNVYSYAGIDIGGGAGNDALGQAMALIEIVALLIYNQTGSAGNLLIGGQGTANAWTSWISSNAATLGPVKPGGLFQLGMPGQPAMAVGNANNNLLRVAASGGNVTYNIFILGRQ
jgi:hypothetical protein